MKPAERRLLQELPTLRRHMASAGVLALLGAVLVVAQASLLAALLADGFDGHLASGTALAALGGVLALRAALAWARGMLAH